MAKEFFERTLLLGLVGATGAGKTSLGKRLAEEEGFVRVHMGQPIKDMLVAIGVTYEELNGPPTVRSAPSTRLSGRSPRYAMQTLGTDWGRSMISVNRLGTGDRDRRAMGDHLFGARSGLSR